MHGTILVTTVLSCIAARIEMFLQYEYMQTFASFRNEHFNNFNRETARKVAVNQHEFCITLTTILKFKFFYYFLMKN